MTILAPPGPLIALKLMIKTRLDYEKNVISVRTKLVTVSRRLVGEIAMSVRPGRSTGRDARRIIGAGGSVGALPECGMASPAVAPPVRADVIGDSRGDLDAFDFVGGGTFDTLGGSTAALFGDAWGVLQTAVAGPDRFAAIDTDLPPICRADTYRPAWQDLAGSVCQRGPGGAEGTAVPVVRGPSAPPAPTAAHAS